jgi:hypothetical protein
VLGELAAGSALGPGVVVELGAVRGGRLPIGVAIAGSVGRLELALRNDDGPDPLVVTERYGIYWNSSGAGTNRLTDSALAELATALGRIVAAHEATAPVPAGLAPFHERERRVAPGNLSL